MEQAELSSFSFNTPTRQGNARRRERRKWVGLAVMIIIAMLPGSFLLPAPAPAWTPPAAQRLNLRGQSSINFEETGFVDSNQTASSLLNPLLAHAMGEGHRPRFRHLPAADEPFVRWIPALRAKLQPGVVYSWESEAGCEQVTCTRNYIDGRMQTELIALCPEYEDAIHLYGAVLQQQAVEELQAAWKVAHPGREPAVASGPLRSSLVDTLIRSTGEASELRYAQHNAVSAVQLSSVSARQLMQANDTWCVQAS